MKKRLRDGLTKKLPAKYRKDIDYRDLAYQLHNCTVKALTSDAFMGRMNTLQYLFKNHWYKFKELWPAVKFVREVYMDEFMLTVLDKREAFIERAHRVGDSRVGWSRDPVQRAAVVP